MKRKKGACPTGSRSLADQLRSAFPKEKESPPVKKPAIRGEVRPTVRVIPAKPPSPQAPRHPQTVKRKQPTAPPQWEPTDEDVFLETAFPDSVASSVVDTQSLTRRQDAVKRSDAAGIARTSTRASIHVGLDFGTSATKVLWVRTGVSQRRVRAIDFGHGLADLPSFCLPSVAAFDSHGRLAFGDRALKYLKSGPAEGALSRFKMLVAGDVDKKFLDAHNRRRFSRHVFQSLGDENACSPESITTAYLAFVMRRARREIAVTLGDMPADLTFNTCVPVDQTENDAVFAAFSRIASAAERVESEAGDSEPGRRWLERAETALDAPTIPSAEAKVHLVPEALAGTAAYLNSLQRDSGLHALVDIGAGTTDISIFNLRDEVGGGEESVWYAARSIPRGTAHTELRVAAELRKMGAPAHPSNIRAVLSEESGAPAWGESLVREELEATRQRTEVAWRAAYEHMKKQSSWTGDAVKVFLSGGGALIPVAKSVFSESWIRSWGPYPCGPIPDPDGYDATQIGGPFARLCVAYGLTIPLPELGDWTLPGDAPNHTPPPAPRRIIEDDGDQLLPKYGWT